MKLTLSAITGILLLSTLATTAENANAQGDDIAGTYTVISTAAFGDHPRGQMILSPDGHYSIVLARTKLPKVAAGVRDQGTAAENKAIVDGSIAHWGRYQVDPQGQSIRFDVEGSTFPNWDGTSFERPYRLSGDQLIYTNTAPSGGGSSFEVVWQRVM